MGEKADLDGTVMGKAGWISIHTNNSGLLHFNTFKSAVFET